MNLPDNPLSISQTFKTAGELKSFLAMFPEDMPLFTDCALESCCDEGVSIYCANVKKSEYCDDYLYVENGGVISLCFNSAV